MAYALIPRRDQSMPSLGTLLYNPGGPGIAGIAQADTISAQLAPLLDRRELLLVDPRGTGRSGALRCRALDADDAFAPRAAFVRSIGACGRELGDRASLYGTAAVADDLEAVRATLGLDRVDVWGTSYGTYLSQVYAARHREHIRSMVLSGAYPIRFDRWGLDRLRAARRAVHLICARTRACSGDKVLDDVATLAARLHQRPATFTITAEDRKISVKVDDAALAALVYANGDAKLLGEIPAAVASGRANDLAPLRRLIEARLRSKANLFDPRLASIVSPAQSFATQCHDYPRAFSLVDPLRTRRAAYLRARTALGERAFHPFTAAAWTSADLEATAGDLDTNTPSSAGRSVARRFPNATFIEIPNAGHTPTDSPCGLELGLRFIAAPGVHQNACAARKPDRSR